MRSQAFLSAALVLGAVVGSLWWASQYVGASLNYPDWLGGEIYRTQIWALYWPYSFLWWMAHGLYPYARTESDTAFQTIFVVDLSAMAIAILSRALFGRGRVEEFGRKGWGTLRDAIKAGIWWPGTPNLDGRNILGLRFGFPAMPRVVLGRWPGRKSMNRILRYDGPEHHLISGASRAGKGVGHVIPTLLSWPESAFVYDPKEEAYDITAEFRNRYVGPTFFVNFTRQDSACFNPLFEVRKGTSEIADAQNIAAMLVDPSGSQQSLDFFQTSSKELLTAVILHVLYSAPLERKTLAEVRRCVLNIKPILEDMWNSDHQEVRLIGQRYTAMENKVRDSVLATCSTCLELYADPIVAKLTSRSDFMVGDLVCASKPVTCYLQTPPSDATRLRPLTRLILSQVAQCLIAKLDVDQRGRKKKHKLLYLIDEFPTLGWLGFFSTNLRIMAGYGIKAMIIVQSFKDIIEAYGQNNTIIDNCHVLVAFATADSDTARRISEMSGRVTEYRRSDSQHGGPLGRQSQSYSEVQRNLLEPGDVRTLPYDEQLVFVTGIKPFRTKKLRYFEERLFKARATDVLKGGRGPDQSKGPRVPFKTAHHDWLSAGASTGMGAYNSDV
jgi:type IV secretion system protein VirD4